LPLQGQGATSSIAVPLVGIEMQEGLEFRRAHGGMGEEVSQRHLRHLVLLLAELACTPRQVFTLHGEEEFRHLRYSERTLSLQLNLQKGFAYRLGVVQERECSIQETG
jgi:hypothetical protein